jgi:tetratricopeptide (TPR) repeat protein
MIKRDYILRLVDQLVRVLTDAFGLTHTKDFEGGLQTLDQFLREVFGWNSEFVNAMPDDYLVGMLKTGERLDVDQVMVLAVLLKSEGDIYAAQGETAKAYHRHLKALNLFLAARASGVPRAVPDEWDQTEEVIEKLAEYELPPATMRRLWRYFQKMGQYTKAEDMLWTLLSATEFDPEVAEEGVRFYEELLTWDDTALGAASLSRAELAEGLEALKQLE